MRNVRERLERRTRNVPGTFANVWNVPGTFQAYPEGFGKERTFANVVRNVPGTFQTFRTLTTFQTFRTTFLREHCPGHRLERGGGVATYVRDGLLSEELFASRHTRTERLDIRVKCAGGRHYDISNVYHPPDTSVGEDDFDPFDLPSGPDVIVAGDLNAHHASWSNRTSRRGRCLNDWATAAGMKILNDGTATWHRGGSATAPDVFITWPDLPAATWTVIGNTGSDHDAMRLQQCSTNPRGQGAGARWGRAGQFWSGQALGTQGSVVGQQCCGVLRTSRSVVWCSVASDREHWYESHFPDFSWLRSLKGLLQGFKYSEPHSTTGLGFLFDLSS